MTHKIKALSLFLAVILLFISIPVVTDYNPQAATITTAYIEGDNVNVRKSPSTSATVLDKLSHTSVTVVDKTTVSGEVWYKITYTASSGTITGYIFYNPDYIRIVTYDPDAGFESKIKAFPESYRDALRALHAKYPNWEFIPDPVKSSFSSAVSAQASKSIYKQVQLNSSSHPISWRSMGLGSYDWSTGKWVDVNGGWTGASREIIAYYMDPRNFLNANEIYMFLEQSYNSAVQNEAGVKKIIKGTFLEKNYTPASGETGGGSYLKVIMAAAKESKVNPYIIASKIIQEQGTKGTSSLISGTYTGYKGYYNFFNVEASGSTSAAVIKNGLSYAKNMGWNTRYKSILGGAQFLGKNYINKGQDTYYYQDYNVHGDISHQYAQAVHDAYNKGKNLADTYKSEEDMSLSFKIPVFTDMPSKVAEKPAKSDKRNNYYFSAISVSGLTPSFSKFTTEYDLRVTGDTAIKVTPVSGATNTSKSSYSLKKGINTITLTVKSETGYTNSYKISVNATKACTLYVNSTGKLPTGSSSSSSSGSSSNSSGSSSNTSSTKIYRGDANGNGKIDIGDLAKIQMHLLNVKKLTGNYLTAADTNKDGNVNLKDLAGVQMHLLGVKTIEQ